MSGAIDNVIVSELDCWDRVSVSGGLEMDTHVIKPLFGGLWAWKRKIKKEIARRKAKAEMVAQINRELKTREIDLLAPIIYSKKRDGNKP